MRILEPIQSFFMRLDQKKFYTYVIVYSVICILLIAAILYYYYSTTSALQKRIKNLNSSREEVLSIMEKAALVKQQQSIVEETLAKDPDFKIQGTLRSILSKPTINLLGKLQGTGEITATDLEDNYRKNELSVKFDGMTMQELTRLLEEIEKNPRIATEKLDIVRKKERTIEVGLTISTLLPKLEGVSP